MGLEHMPLAEQCMALGLELIEIKRKNPATPLGEGLTYFKEKGYEGTYCKSGPLLMLLRSVLLDLLEKLNLFRSRKDATVRRFEDLLLIHRDQLEMLKNEILHTQTDKYLDNFQEIYAFSAIVETYPGLSAPTIQRIFESLGKDRLANVLEMLVQNPYLYTGGWPDLTLFNPKRLFFSEVKTKDGLTEKQMETIPNIKRLLDLDVKILKIIN